MEVITRRGGGRLFKTFQNIGFLRKKKGTSITIQESVCFNVSLKEIFVYREFLVNVQRYDVKNQPFYKRATQGLEVPLSRSYQRGIFQQNKHIQGQIVRRNNEYNSGFLL